MPIAKNNSAVAEQPKTTTSEVAQTAPAPVSRKIDTGLTKEPVNYTGKKEYKERDFDAEARGKVACVAFNAALSSPGLAGLGFTNYAEYMSYVRKAADESVAYTWEKQQGK